MKQLFFFSQNVAYREAAYACKLVMMVTKVMQFRSTFHSLATFHTNIPVLNYHTMQLHHYQSMILILLASANTSI